MTVIRPPSYPEDGDAEWGDYRKSSDDGHQRDFARIHD